MTKILIVEDVDTMRQLLTHMIGKMPGFSVSGSAANGWETRLEVTRRRPDLVLLDEVLPGESTQEILAFLKDEGLAVILLTGVSEPSHEILEYALGRIIKPSKRDVQREQLRIQAEISRLVQGA